MLVGIAPKMEWGIWDKDFCDEEGNHRAGYSTELLAPFRVSKHAIIRVDEAHHKCQTAKGKYDIDRDYADPTKTLTRKYKNETRMAYMLQLT